MSHHSESFLTAPQALFFDQVENNLPDNKIELIVKGQGTFAFKNAKSKNFYIQFKFGKNRLSFKVNKDHAELLLLRNNVEHSIRKYKHIQIDPAPKALYWFSLDALTKRIKFGIGEVRNDLTLLDQKLGSKLIKKASSKPIKKIQSKLFNVDAFFISDNITPIQLYRDPVVYDPSLKIKKTDEITIEDIARNNYVIPSDLTESCQKLYNNISGDNFNLNTSDFPDFVDAIEASIRNPNGWCFKTLRAKAKEFGEENIEETYLRITLGANQGESPGIPYVIEIWPPNHYSPIHNHGNANAIIRVLHGEINVALYPMLSSYHCTPFKKATFREGEITWISPRYNQFHKLHNINTDGPSCITIQCYLYAQDNIEHYKYFDYLNDKETIEQFTPNSDADYLQFKKIIRKEWKKVKK